MINVTILEIIIIIYHISTMIMTFYQIKISFLPKKEKKKRVS